jgi:hypothetical protein
VRATLFALPASHPSLAAQLMLEHKGVAYRRIDLVTATHRTVLRALGSCLVVARSRFNRRALRPESVAAG